METKTLSVEDICAIIEKCGESGVSSFEWENLKFSFKDKEKRETEKLYVEDFQGQEVVSNENFVDEEGAVKEDELLTKEEQFVNAVLEDPLLAEEILASEDRMEDLLDELGVPQHG